MLSRPSLQRTSANRWVLLASLCAATHLPAAEHLDHQWPGFRGLRQSITTASSLPLNWSETENVA